MKTLITTVLLLTSNAFAGEININPATAYTEAIMIAKKLMRAEYAFQRKGRYSSGIWFTGPIEIERGKFRDGENGHFHVEALLEAVTKHPPLHCQVSVLLRRQTISEISEGQIVVDSDGVEHVVATPDGLRCRDH